MLTTVLLQNHSDDDKIQQPLAGGSGIPEEKGYCYSRVVINFIMDDGSVGAISAELELTIFNR